MTIHSYPQDGHARPKATADFLKVTTVTLWRWEKPNPTSRNLPAYQNEYQFMMQQRSVLGWQLKKIVNQRINFIVLSLISAIGSESIYLIKNIYIVW